MTDQPDKDSSAERMNEARATERPMTIKEAEELILSRLIAQNDFTRLVGLMAKVIDERDK